MTEDPVKLYVVVMSILLCVLAFVAITSYNEAAAFEKALDNSDRQAERLKEYAADVRTLTDQLSKSKIELGPRTLIQEAATALGVKHSSIGEQRSERHGAGKIRRYNVEISRTKPLTREQVARFCQAVERDSRGILKTLELTLNRATGPGLIAPGKEDKVVDDLYRGTIIFGQRVVE